jgi:hypothetical protein
MTDLELVDQIIAAVQGAQWAALAGGAMLAVVIVYRRTVGDRWLDGRAGALVDAILATGTAAGAALVSGAEWYRALLLAVLVAAPAHGLYSRLGEAIRSARS